MSATPRRTASSILALGCVVLLAAAPVRADDGAPPRWPEAAERRFETARELMQRGQSAAAAAAYREVAEWPEGGDFPQRAQALFLAALLLEQARDLERAVATYEETARRFPATDWARKATAAREALEPSGARGLEFRRRLDAAWDVLLPALETARRHGPDAARVELERALGLLTSLLAEHEEHPRAKDVALAIGETHMRLGGFESARVAFERAVALARREAARPGAAPLATTDVASALAQVSEAVRAGRRQTLVRFAWVLLASTLVGLGATRPWRAASRATGRWALRFAALDGALAALAAFAADYVHQHVDDHSPLEPGAAAVLVLAPALVGQGVALLLVPWLRPRLGRGALFLGGGAAALAALALATTLVAGFGLFPYLDSEL